MGSEMCIRDRINTLLGLALLLLIFFTFFSVSFKLNVGEGDDTNLACNRRRPEETDGDGASKTSWLAGLGCDESCGDNDDPVLNAKSGDEDSSFWF